MTNARFSILQARAVKDPEISNSQFRTLAALGIYGDKDGWCWPKLATLAEQLNKSRQAISKDIQKLKELEYIEIHPQNREDGGRSYNKYRMLFDSIPPQSSIDGCQPGDEAPSTPEIEAPSTSEVDALTPQVNDPIELYKREPQTFDEMQVMIEALTGYPAIGEDDINALNEMAVLKVIAQDVEYSIAFFEDKDLVARGPAHILKSVKFQRSKRIQSASARKPKNDKPPVKEFDQAKADRLKLEVKAKTAEAAKRRKERTG